MRRVLLAGAALLMLSGCATTYGEIDGMWGDGVTADRLTADTYRIRSRLNESTDPDLVQDFALLRAAETARGVCGTHFIVEGGDDRTLVTEGYTPASETRTIEQVKDKAGKVVKEVEHVTRTEESYSTGVRPGADLYIRVLSLGSGARPPEGALSADEVITHVGARVKRRRGDRPFIPPFCPEQPAAVASR